MKYRTGEEEREGRVKVERGDAAEGKEGKDGEGGIRGRVA